MATGSWSRYSVVGVGADAASWGPADRDANAAAAPGRMGAPPDAPLNAAAAAACSWWLVTAASGAGAPASKTEYAGAAAP